MHPPFQMPTFEKEYKIFQFPIIKHFEYLIAEKGFDVKKFWDKIDDAIVKIVRNSEPYIIQTVSLLYYFVCNYSHENIHRQQPTTTQHIISMN